MGERQRNGVDGAIALLLALARLGEQSSAALAREIGVPRASFHRIVRTLAASGIVESGRGTVRVGPIGLAFIRANAEAALRDDRSRAQRAQQRGKHPAATEAVLSTPPLKLSRPVGRLRPRRYRIGFSNASMDNPWRIALVHSVEHAVANLGNAIEWLAVRHAEDNARQQIEDIDALVAQGVDGLIVSAAAPRTIGDAVSRAMARGIAVVLVDRGVAPGVPHTSFVTTDDEAIGRTTALWLAETLKGQGGILMLAGRADAEPAQRRFAAAQQVFAGFEGITTLAIEWTGWQRQIAHDIVSQAIGRWGPAIAGVWCDSGLQGVGSLRAFIDAGFGPGTIPPHTGGDLNLAYKLAIRQHVPLAAVDYPPAMGTKAVDVLFAALGGRWVPSFVNVASDIILTRDAATRSVKPHIWAEKHVRWDLPDDLVLASGLGPAYNPRLFRIHYPGNSYNRSAAQLAKAVSP